MEVKYGILAYEKITSLPQEGYSCIVDQNELISIKPMNKTFPKLNDGTHWERWLGSLEWERFKNSEVQFQVWTEARHDDPIDSVNVKLTERLMSFAQSLMLKGLYFIPNQRPRFITGRATLIGGSLSPIDIQTTGSGPKWINPIYSSSKDYIRFKGDFRTSKYTLGDEFFEELKNIYGGVKLIRERFKENLIVNYSLISFLEGLRNNYVDFSLPCFVRAIESLVPLSIGQGKKLFAKRAGSFVSDIADIPFCLNSESVHDLLEKTYDARSDCVHGKIVSFGENSLPGKMGKEEVAASIFLLETVARKAITAYILNPDLLSRAKDRISLEKYWNEKIPH